MKAEAAAAREVAFTGAAAAFVAFAVWGSLFPFDVRAVSAGEAARLFWLPWQSGPATWSKSDLVSNVLLFMPIGLFLSAALDTRIGNRRAIGAAMVVAVACALSTAVELCQAFVPYRTPSAVDVMAETLGAALGVAALAAARVMDRHADLGGPGRLRARLGPVPPPDRVLRLFAIAWLLPLDFTLRPGEIADKYEHKRLLLPFAASPDAASPAALSAAFAAGLPLGVALVLWGSAPGRRRALTPALRLAIPSLLALEAIQVTVFSRTTDTTSLLAVIAATVAGASRAR